MKEIKGIGFDIPTENESYLRIDSLSSLSDIDIAVFSPNLNDTPYSTYESNSFSGGTYEGKKLYNKESSARLIDHSKHWKTELLHFIERGGTLFVILCKKEDFFIYTGTKDISGTGRNQKVTNHVTPFSNYNFLPFKNINFNASAGKTVVPSNNLVNDLSKNFKDFMSFETYISDDGIKQPLFTTKNKDRILGTHMKIKEGHVIFLPNTNLDLEAFTRHDKKTNKSYWTDEAIKKGKIFISCLVEIDKTLRKTEEKTPKPSWINNSEFGLEKADNTIRLIEENNKEIERRKEENKNLNAVLEEQESLKDLLFETGKPLESAVIKALKILGYSAENYDDGELELDQIIVSPEGHRFIGECEGKDNKDIDVSKFRQLLDALNADFEKTNVEVKAFGLLFGNPQRLINPSERTLDFTKKCKAGAQREKIGLIKTEDLFKVCKYIDEKSDWKFAEKCRKAILKQLGEVVKFPEIK